MSRQFNASQGQIPFLCPPKYQYEYYEPLLNESLKHHLPFIIQYILYYVCGDLDYCQQNDFFTSSAAKAIISALDDEQSPHFNLSKNCDQNLKIDGNVKIILCEHDINKWKYNKDDKLNQMMNTEHMEPNTMTLTECHDIVSTFNLKDKYNNDFESIWFWETYGSMMNAGDYGEYETDYTIIGQLRYKSLENKNIYLKIYLTHYTEDYLVNDMYTLSFTFSDSLEAFWIDGVHWKYFRKQSIKPFDPNPPKQSMKPFISKKKKHENNASFPTLEEIQSNQQKQADLINEQLQETKTKSVNCTIL